MTEAKSLVTVGRRRGQGEDAIYFDAARNRYIGAVCWASAGTAGGCAGRSRAGPGQAGSLIGDLRVGGLSCCLQLRGDTLDDLPDLTAPVLGERAATPGALVRQVCLPGRALATSAGPESSISR